VLVLGLCLWGLTARAETITANHTPWSGYWWPMKDGGLLTGRGYNGLPAPLDKYAVLDSANGAALKIAYANKYYKPGGDSWWGMCWEWALAASVEPEPTKASVFRNVPFHVGDKKALLTLAHSNDVVVFGNGADPVVFHSWLIEKVKGLGKVIVVDLDPGPEIWSYPVHKYEMTQQVVGNAVHVTCKIFYPDDFVHPDYVGMDLRFNRYTYTLMRDLAGNIVSGSWTGESVTHHPDTLTLHVAKNLDGYPLDFELASTIAQSTDDEMEGQDFLHPGSYLLALQNIDSFALVPPSSAQLSWIRVAKVNRTDSFSGLLYGTGGQQTALEFGLDGVAHFYDQSALAQRLSLTPGAAYSAGLYSLVVDAFVPDMDSAPYLHQGDAWLGVAQAAPKSGQGGMIVGRAMDGDPVRTFAADRGFVAGGKRSLMIDMAAGEYGLSAAPVGLDLYPGQAEVGSVVLAGGASGMLASYGQAISGRRLISPGAVLAGVGYSQYTVSVRNKSFAQNNVRVRSYSNAGQLNDETVVQLSPRETRVLAFGNSPFYRTTMHNWLMFDADADIEVMGSARSGAKPTLGENFYASPAEDTTFYVPHAPVSGGWSTFVTMINPNDQPVSISLFAHAGGNMLGQMAVPAKGKVEINLASYAGVHALGGQVLRLQSALPVTGYLTYVAGGDAGTMPLLRATDAQGRLHLPHAPTFQPWWTGLALANISGNARTVSVTAYDSAGNVLPVDRESISIAPGRTMVTMVNGLVGSRHGQVGSLVLSCSDPNAIVGFYLYGNTARTMLTGNNFR